MKLGRWGQLPLKMGGGRSRAENLYIALRDQAGEAYSKDDNALVNREKRVVARAMARAASYQARGALQFFPEKAVDALPIWEQRLGVVPTPTDRPHQRRAILKAIRRGNGPPTYERILAALKLALDGEDVALLTSMAPLNSKSPPAPGAPPTITVITGGGELLAGAHSVRYAFRDIGGNVGPISPARTITTPGGAALLVAPIVLPSGVVAVDYYLSTSVNASSAQIQFAMRGGGGPVVLALYPRNAGAPGLHHHSVIVKPTTWADPIKRRKIHLVLGPMLSSWTGYTIATSSPFILGTSIAAGASPLGSGAF